MALYPTPSTLPLLSLHKTPRSSAGYFDFDPSTQSEDALIQTAMSHSHSHSQVLRMDAFAFRTPTTHFTMPENAHLYAARPLPALPNVQRSPTRLVIPESRRPSLTSKDRAATTDCVERPLPPLPLRTSTYHRRGVSIESTASSRLSESEMTIRRPRTMRSASFKNFFKAGGPPPQLSPTESVRTASSMSEHSDSYDSRHDSILIDDLGLSLSKTSTPASSAPGSRRPSTLSLASLRSRKISQESNSIPSRPVSARKNSQSTGPTRRWNIFGAEKIAPIEDEENVPPVPFTPTSTAEMSCHRCHYYSLRNCNGWVMGGSHGDACESCTMHGFFGSP